MDKLNQFKIIVAPVAQNEKVASKYAEHLDELFTFISPEKISERYAAAVKNGDFISAAGILAKHFRNIPDFTVPELSAKAKPNTAIADKAINGIMREVNIDWTFPDGDIDFLFDPTQIKKPVNHEWLWQFNRHGYWRAMACAYNATKDEKYAAAFQKQLLAWIAQTYVPEKWNGPGSAWRTIECGLRLSGSWQVAFDGFKCSPSLDDVTVLLMVASMHRQSAHLVAHPTKGNWLMMEMNGVYAFSSLFNEFSDSEKNRKIAADYLLKELEAQLLPDGMQNELSPDYHRVVFNCVANFYSLACALGMKDEIPEGFIKLMRDSVRVSIQVTTPAFTQPRTNDTFTIRLPLMTERAATLLGDTPEYRYVNTNRREGNPPEGKTASVFLPYAGFAAMRSDWGADATYMCFDVGPLGMAHIHQDKLNINIYKGDEELIFDDGGGQYEISPARTYACSGYGHNTVLVDGMAQYRKAPGYSEKPIDAGWLSNESYDYAVGVYDDTFGPEMLKPATHKREVRFCKPEFFCVSDTLASADGMPHDYELLFHLDTTKIKELAEYENGIISDFGKKYDIVLIPLDDESAKPELLTVSAATEPMYQGWYNGRNEAYLHEAITVSRKVSGVKDYRFTTLLFPVTASDALPKVTKNGDGTVSILFKDKNYTLAIDKLNA